MYNFDKRIMRIIKPKQFGGKNDRDGDGVPNKKDCQPNNTMRQDKVYMKGPNGYNIRFHRGVPSQPVLNAMEEFVDQIKWRSYEYGLYGPNGKQGYTNLAETSIRNNIKNDEDKQQFIKELKARKYSIDYSQL